jgi:orotate phosphoribosyltransferase
MHSRARTCCACSPTSLSAGRVQTFFGGTSDYYIDCRTTTLDAKGARLTGEVFSTKSGSGMEAAGHRRADHGCRSDCGGGFGGERRTERLSGAQGGKAARDGTAHRRLSREGCAGGDCGRCLHHRASTVQAIEAAREFGFEVVGAMCLVEREEAKGRPNVEKAAAPAPFVSIFTARTCATEHVLQTDDTNP